MRLQGLDTELEQTVASVLGYSQEMGSMLEHSHPVVLGLLHLAMVHQLQVQT